MLCPYGIKCQIQNESEFGEFASAEGNKRTKVKIVKSSAYYNFY